jgi:hypothetical protein
LASARSRAWPVNLAFIGAGCARRLAVRCPRRSATPPLPRPKLDVVADFLNQGLDADRQAPREQRQTARRLYRRILTAFPDAAVAESTMRNHVRERKRHMGWSGRRPSCRKVTVGRRGAGRFRARPETTDPGYGDLRVVDSRRARRPISSRDDRGSAPIRDRFSALSPHLNERERRLLAATEATAAGMAGLRRCRRPRASQPARLVAG